LFQKKSFSSPFDSAKVSYDNLLSTLADLWTGFRKLQADNYKWTTHNLFSFTWHNNQSDR
jgi:hypothetical protein